MAATDRTIRISATEASRNFSDLLNRVQYREEKFEISRGRTIVASIIPPETKAKPIGGFLHWLSERRHLDGADADDFEKLIEELRHEKPQPEPEWD